MKKNLKKIAAFIITLVVVAFGTTENPIKDEVVAGFGTMRGFATLQSTTTTDVSYDFAVVNVPIERAGAASSSTGFEFGHALITSATAFTTATTSTGFAVTMQTNGKIKGCAFSLQTVPTTGTVSIQVQLNGTLQTGKYCKLGDFGTNGDVSATSTTDVFLEDNLTFIAGDRVGLIASSSNLNAATHDGTAQLTVQLDN